MGASVVLSVYSGRPNPRWQLDGDAENDIVRRLASLPTDPVTEVPRRPTLGYRGFTIELSGGDGADRNIVVFGASVREGKTIRRDAGHELELQLLETAPQAAVDTVLVDHVRKAIASFPRRRC